MDLEKEINKTSQQDHEAKDGDDRPRGKGKRAGGKGKKKPQLVMTPEQKQAQVKRLRKDNMPSDAEAAQLYKKAFWKELSEEEKGLYAMQCGIKWANDARSMAMNKAARHGKVKSLLFQSAQKRRTSLKKAPRARLMTGAELDKAEA